MDTKSILGRCVKCATCQVKVDTFYEILDEAIDYHFLLKVIKRHNADKPWLTGRIKYLTNARQRAFIEGNKCQFRALRNKIIREIKSAKHHYYAGRIRKLQRDNLGRWHREVRNMTNLRKSDRTIYVHGIDPSDFKITANRINEYLASFSQS